jgi:hypothetical protein
MSGPIHQETAPIGLGLRHQSALLYFVADCVSANFVGKPTHRVVYWVRRDRVVFDVTIMLRAFMLMLSYCSVAQSAAEAIWPTKQWQTSTPEEQGMDSAAQSLRNPVGARPLPPGIPGDAV